MILRRVRLACLLVTLGLFACGGESPVEGDSEVSPNPTTAFPPGTALAVSGIPVPVAEIDELATALAQRYPANVELQNRRLAVTNETLQRYAVRARDQVPRGAAELACAQAHEELQAGAEPEGAFQLRGDFREFRNDLRLWVRARELTPETWSEPIELIGRFVLVRVDGREREYGPVDDDQAATEEEILDLTVLHFPYLDTSYRDGLDAATSIGEAVDAAHLEIVDPAFEDVVPMEWKYRMGAER